MRRIALFTLTLSFLASIPACSTMSTGAMNSLANAGTSYSYGAGRATQNFAYPPTTVQPAVLAAMEDLRIQAVRQINDGSTIVFEGTTADNRNASVTLRPNSLGTRLTARVGLFGDQALSRAIMDRIGIRLGSLPPAAIPEEPPSTPASNPYFSRSAISDAEMLKDRLDNPDR